MSLTAPDAAPVNAVLPVQVRVQDANGVSTEGSGFYATKKGELEIALDLAPNEDPGTWQIQVRDLASGMEAVKWMTVGK